MPRRFGITALHLFTLFNLLVAYPLYEVLGSAEHASFFSAHQTQPLDIWIMVFVFSFALPALAWLLVALGELISRQLAVAILALFVFFLVSLLLARPLGLLLPLSDSATLALIVAVSAGVVRAYLRVGWLSMFVSFLCPAIVIVPVLFLTLNPVSWVLSSPAQDDSRDLSSPSDRPNIVMIVLDELPLFSLLDVHREIDPTRFENFARLGERSTLFRNTTALHYGTFHALPPILTGSELEKYSRRHKASTTGGSMDRRRLPDNIFSLFEATHEIRALESLSHLAPEPRNVDENYLPVAAERVDALLADTFILGGHVLLPALLKTRLPPIAGMWRDFDQAEPVQQAPEPQSGMPWLTKKIDRFVEFTNLIEDTRWPVFYFAHFQLPHFPYVYDENGRHSFRYAIRIKNDSMRQATGQNNWPGQEVANLALQSHLLQVVFTDRLLGRILDKLEEQGLFDDSLIIVTADHGASFYWDSEGLSPGELQRIQASETLHVPLFVKKPGQRQGAVSEKPLTTADILATVAEIMGVNVPWDDGSLSALGKIPDDRSRSAVIQEGKEGKLEWQGPVDPDYRALQRKSRLLGGKDADSLYALGPYTELIGKPVSGYVRLAGPAGVNLEFSPRTQNVRPGPYYTQHMEISIKGDLDILGDPDIHLAIAINDVVRATTFFGAGQAETISFLARIPVIVGINRLSVFGISADADAEELRLIEYSNETK